jgi:hypothetical protein
MNTSTSPLRIAAYIVTALGLGFAFLAGLMPVSADSESCGTRFSHPYFNDFLGGGPCKDALHSRTMLMLGITGVAILIGIVFMVIARGGAAQLHPDQQR